MKKQRMVARYKVGVTMHDGCGRFSCGCFWREPRNDARLQVNLVFYEYNQWNQLEGKCGHCTVYNVHCTVYIMCILTVHDDDMYCAMCIRAEIGIMIRNIYIYIYQL